jgi:hypothetical protein
MVSLLLTLMMSSLNNRQINLFSIYQYIPVYTSMYQNIQAHTKMFIDLP